MYRLPSASLSELHAPSILIWLCLGFPRNKVALFSLTSSILPFLERNQRQNAEETTKGMHNTSGDCEQNTVMGFGVRQIHVCMSARPSASAVCF